MNRSFKNSWPLVGVLISLFLAPLFALAEDPIELTPIAEESITPVAPEEPKFCPAADKVQNECGRDKISPDTLFGESAGFNPWGSAYSTAPRCALWWWAEHAQGWQYGPLTEWSRYVQDALMENLSRRVIWDTVGPAPVPPNQKLNKLGAPISSCKPPTGQEWLYLAEKLKRLNLRTISPELLLSLTHHCLAFEVEASPWQRMSSKVVASYVLPVGDVYFVILAQTHYNVNGPPTKNRPDNYIVATKEFGITFTTVGECPVTKEPRACVEEMISKAGGKAAFAYSEGFTRRIKTLPFHANIDSLYSGGGIEEPLDVEMQVEEDGNLYFFLVKPSGQRTRIRLTIDEEGVLALDTDERLCDPSEPEGKPLRLRPIAFGKEVKKLYKELEAYGPSDFPESKRLATSGIEKGCNSGKSYSQWVADTANAAKHYALHGMPWDTLFRSTAFQRFKWSLKSIGVPQIRDNLVYGQWRKEAQESPVTYGSNYEKQAAKFARQSNDGVSEANITYRTILIDDIPATEVWYYAKPVTFWPGQPKQGHVLINHLKNYDDIYSRSVIAKLVELSTTCAEMKDHKRGFLAAMYALFNASPLQKGNDAVGKAFMAAVYHNLFGYKIRAMKKMIDVDFDAQTMGMDEFIDKYMPLIN